MLVGTQKKINAEYFGVKISPTSIEEEITEKMVEQGIALVPAGVYREPCLSFEGEKEALDDLWDEQDEIDLYLCEEADLNYAY